MPLLPGQGRLNPNPEWPFWISPPRVIALGAPVGAYTVEVLADSPVAYWRLGASPFTDSSGNGNTLTASASAPTSAASLLTSDADPSSDFSGSSQYYTAVDSASLSLSAPLTIEAWIITDTIDVATRTIVRKDGIQFALRRTTANLEYYYDDGAARGVGVASSLAAGTLYHVAVTDDGTTVRFYVNGVNVSSPARPTGTAAIDTAGAVAIGATYSAGSPSEFWDGRIDEVAIYGTALSAGRIAVHYAAGTASLPGLTQQVDDTATVTDAAPTFDRDVVWPLADTVTPSDALTFDRQNVLADSVTMSDSVTASAGFSVTVTDSVAMSDSAVTAAGKGATVTDSVTMSDGQTFDRGLTVADSVTMSDGQTFDRAILVTDTVAMSDVCTPVLTSGGTAWTQPVADTVTVTDAAPTFVRQFGIQDTITVTDGQTFQLVYQRTITDTVTMTDSASAVVTGPPVEGYPGVFDPDTETGRGTVTVDEPDYVPVSGGRIRAPATSPAFSSVQGGKIGVR